MQVTLQDLLKSIQNHQISKPGEARDRTSNRCTYSFGTVKKGHFPVAVLSNGQVQKPSVPCGSILYQNQKPYVDTKKLIKQHKINFRKAFKQSGMRQDSQQNSHDTNTRVIACPYLGHPKPSASTNS
ncbi:hypothetical protein WN944_003635 [Citrus x changshan-huyou]|uniref:Uncharacterized protein n=1 Tax=Citrus x changshan-huyou TaxID=2935761 RepID=A0AAP0LYZ8_9ROSI